MIAPAFPRRLAAVLLQSALRFAPAHTVDWGHAMLGELRHVEGNWSALLWSLGGTGVLAKHAFIAMIFPNANRSVLPGGHLFDKESSMRKPILAATCACVLASLLFFLAPVFRQAFHISLAQWHDVFHVEQSFGYRKPDPELSVLAKKAEQTHDAEGLAFVALRQSSPDESVRLADEAVQLDPKLTWVYGLIAAQYSSFPQFDRWVSELEKYDPQNALPHFIVAEKINTDEYYVAHKSIPHIFVRGIGSGRGDHRSPAWQSAMAAAFQSPKLDAYLDRRGELERKVLLRYRVYDPFQAVNDDSWWRGLPVHSAWDSFHYAQLVLESGEALEAQGNREGAIEKYSAVARFGQMMGPAGFLWLPRVQQEAYKRLASLSGKVANKEQAELYAALADQAGQVQRAGRVSLLNRFRGGDVSRWNAFLIRLSGLVLLLCGACLVLCVIGLLVRDRSFKLASLQPGRLAVSLGFGAAVGLLLSSVVLFVSYWPYSEVVQRFLRTGDNGGLPELSTFLDDAQLPLGSQFNPGSGFLGSQMAAFYFWFAVAVLCLLALLFVVWRFQRRLRAPGELIVGQRG